MQWMSSFALQLTAQGGELQDDELAHDPRYRGMALT
jgi:hypothetical protein